MCTGRFDPSARAIFVEVRLWGRLGDRRARFLLDTGSPVTIIDHGVVSELGYGARMGSAMTTLVGIDGAPRSGYQLALDRLEMMGLVFTPIEVSCHDMEEDLGFEGLIGMDLLDRCVVTIDMREGILRVEGPPASSPERTGA